MKTLSPDDRKRLQRLKRKANLKQVNKIIEAADVRKESDQ